MTITEVTKGAVTLNPDSKRWQTARRFLLLTVAALSLLSLAPRLTSSFWEVSVVAAFMMMVFSKSPTTWSLLVVVIHLLGDGLWGDSLYGPTWLLVYAACVDVNSRTDPWRGGAFVLVTALASCVSAPTMSDAVANAGYMALLGFLGQFVRLSFQSMRMHKAVAALQRRAEREETLDLVHDTTAAHLSQVVALGNSLLGSEQLTEKDRHDLALLVSIARNAATETSWMLAHGQTAPSCLGDVLEGSRQLLEAAGHVVQMELAPGNTMTGLDDSIRLEVTRVVRELTTNMLKYADSALPLRFSLQRADDVVIVCASNGLSATCVAESCRRGLTGLRKRAERLGGVASWGLSEGVFSVRVVLPEVPDRLEGENDHVNWSC